MEINIKLLRYHIGTLAKIRTHLYNDLKYIRFIDTVDAILDEAYVLQHPFSDKFLVHEYSHITNLYASCVKKLQDELYPHIEKFKSSELTKLVVSLNIRIYNIIGRNTENCKDCDSFLIRHRNEWFCQKCRVFKGKIFLSKDEELDDDIKQNKSNISKHFDVNLNRIYGIIEKKVALPACALVQLRKKLDEQGFDITRQVHYSYALINQLRQMKYISCTCRAKTHEIASQKKQVNYIISKIYPEIKIPRLLGLEYIATKNTFLVISAASQQLFPGKYSTAYQYTLHRILNMNYPNREHILELLRFIYPQKQTSFKTKDEKLRAINNKVSCFKEFQPLSSDIYTNISNYRTNKQYNRY